MNATHAVDIEEIQTTRGEKALAVVLGLFLAVGLVWAYVQLDLRDPYDSPPPQLSAQDQAALDKLETAQSLLSIAEAEEAAALSDLEVRRERYRTALDAGRQAPALGAQYRQAEQTYVRAQQRTADAGARVALAQPAADAVSQRLAEEQGEKLLSDERLTFIYRLLLALGVLGASFGLLHVLRGSHWFTLGLAAVGAGAILTLIFAGDYTEDYVELRNNGPVVLSLAGVALTLGAFWSLQRYLRRRIPFRRVRKGECPFCGFPTAGNSSCEGCGRDVAGSCSHCGERRRVGVHFCGSCGKA